MRPPSLRAALPWLIGVSLFATLACLAVAVFLGFSARTDATGRETRRMTAQANEFARDIEDDLALFDLALLEAAARPGAGPTPPRLKLLELPLTARYIGFINVLNEVGDVVADSRSNVSRPVNFAGRDYFQDQSKNPGDSLMIGRPFGMAPNQHASVPISRRLTAPDGAFAGVVVAGVRLTWLSDLLSHKLPGPPFSVTVRRSDGVVLMQSPFDDDAIGRIGADDPAWRDFQQTGVSYVNGGADGIRMFRRIDKAPLVLELALDQVGITRETRSWLIVLPPLIVIPGLCIVLLSIAGHRILRRGRRVEAAANAANDERMRLLATMSHELRTPLTGILGQAELMTEEGGLNDRQAMRLTRLTEAGTLMRNIVNRVIDVARPEDHEEPLLAAPCDLDALIRTRISMIESEARKKGLRLTGGVAPSTPRHVMLVHDLVEQVLINLLMNAVKYTGRGAVTLRVMGDAAHLRFEVADTGAGIPPGKWRRLFREYDRLDSNRTGIEGSGIGLSISERLVRRMGGRIGYRENPSGGNIFWVELPTAEAGMRAVATTESGVPPPPPIGPVRILLADDLDLTRSVTADFLRQAGHSVTEAANGEAAVEAARTGDFDLILTDMRMPIMDGLEAARCIRVLPGQRGRTPVVLVTADLVALGEGASGQAGIDLCLMKPFTRAELLAAVATATRRPSPPRTDEAEPKVLDESTFAELRHGLGDAKLAEHLEAAARRIEDLLGMLRCPDASESATVRDAVHDLVGIAGLLGLAALSSCLRQFDIAEDRAVTVEALREAAARAVTTLHELQVPIGASPHAGRD
jgi:signal transduction histidine kinase/CheY-like chemotaxis protein